MSLMINATPAAPAASHVKDVTAANFMQEVMQASLQTPVLVYFTAAWCGPCKQFGPALEKAVNEAKGRVKLARIDIDKSPQLAQQFRVQSVPMVYIFFQGQPLDAFAGAIPESQIRQLIAQLPTGNAQESEAAQATLEAANTLLAEGRADEAERAYKSLLAADENNPDAIAGLAKCFIAQSHLAKAEQLLAGVTEEQQKHEAIAGAKAALALAKSAPTKAEEKALRDKIARDPLDHQARYDLATMLFAAGRQEEAINELLTIFQKKKDWNEGAARAQLVTFFEALGHTHPLTMSGRRKLSSLLFA